MGHWDPECPLRVNLNFTQNYIYLTGCGHTMHKTSRYLPAF